MDAPPKWSESLPFWAHDYERLWQIEKSALLVVDESLLPDPNFIPLLDGIGDPQLSEEALHEWRQEMAPRFQQRAHALLLQSREALRDELARVDDYLQMVKWLEDAASEGVQEFQAILTEESRVVNRHRELFSQYGNPDDTTTWEQACADISSDLARQGLEASSEIGVLHSSLGRYLSHERKIKDLQRLQRKIVRVKPLYQLKVRVFNWAMNHVESGGSVDDLKLHARDELPATSDRAREYFWHLYDSIRSNPDREWKFFSQLWQSAAKRDGAKGPKQIKRVAENIEKAFKANEWHEPHTTVSYLVKRVKEKGEPYDRKPDERKYSE